MKLPFSGAVTKKQNEREEERFFNEFLKVFTEKSRYLLEIQIRMSSV